MTDDEINHALDIALRIGKDLTFLDVSDEDFELLCMLASSLFNPDDALLRYDILTAANKKIEDIL